MLFLQSLLTFTKKYWQTILLVVVSVYAYYAVTKSREGVAETLKKMQAAYDAEMSQVDAARLEERKQHEANVERLQAELEAEKKDYEEKKKEFEDKRRTEIGTIVQKYGSDPSALADKLSQVTGFQVIIPEGK